MGGDGLGEGFHSKKGTGAGDELNLNLRRARSFRKQVGRVTGWEEGDATQGQGL